MSQADAGTDLRERGDALALAFQDGDPQAFAALVDLFQERFYRVAYRILGDPDEALDVVQDAFVKVHAAIGSWDREARFGSWAFRIVTNLAIDGLRRRGRERKAWEGRAQEQPDVQEDRADEGLAAADQSALVGQIKAAIEGLPPGQRAIVALRHYEGFSLKEIADIRGCALGTVKSTLHQAFRNLRTSLGAEVLEAVGARAGGGER
ncbi:MAG: sigma-70 family RNA polymerase sigma factor [Planctomycetes bacterium]|nr:sigma-70 family RNA polymerase sigma factor [Planctomycetota bacterium]